MRPVLVARWWRSLAGVVLILLLLAASAAAPALAQAGGEGGSEERVDDGDAGLGGIDDILLADEEVLIGEGYTYDPGNRRDPFRSLLAARERPALRGPRPEGIPGLLIDEIDLTGIFVTGEGPVAQVQASDTGRSFLLRVGDQLYDGDVVSITGREVTFKQMVDDPTALKPFREVVKEISP